MLETIAHLTKLPVVTRVVVDDWPKGSTSHIQVQLIGNSLGQIIHVPVMVARGTKAGPILGVTAALHGDELNGLDVIQNLMGEINPKQLKGTVVAVPVVNVPGFLREQRRFIDGRDLNRIMPGRAEGPPSDVYAFRFIDRVTHCFDYLIDLHTASSGRGNSFYVRVDLSDATAAWMAHAQRPEIILNNEPRDGTLRSALSDRGIPAITVELGNPLRFQRRMVQRGTDGLLNVMNGLGMIRKRAHLVKRRPPVICLRSRWLYSRSGGLLRVLPAIGDKIKRGQVVASVHDVYGNRIEEYKAPSDGIVIGKSLTPVNPTGSRILHLGAIATRQQVHNEFPHLAEEG